jgi:Lon protease-like protein
MSEALERARTAVRRLKVFPLSPVVLLPGAAVGLHIFEERYRELLQDALAGDRLFALAQVVPGQERVAGAPQLEQVLCVGTVTAHVQLDDGTSNLMLVGVARARILREHPRTRLYREVEAELLVDPAIPAADPEAVALQAAVVELMARLPTEVAERVAQLTARLQGGALADVLASTILDDVVRRYEVLCEVDVRERMRAVAQETMLLVGTMEARKPGALMN